MPGVGSQWAALTAGGFSPGTGLEIPPAGLPLGALLWDIARSCGTGSHRCEGNGQVATPRIERGERINVRAGLICGPGLVCK